MMERDGFKKSPQELQAFYNKISFDQISKQNYLEMMANVPVKQESNSEFKC